MLPEIHCQTRSLTPSVLLGEQLCSVLSGVPVSATIYPLSLVVGLMISVFILCTSITRFPWTTTWEKTACINQKVRWFYDCLSHTACPRKDGSALWLELQPQTHGRDWTTFSFLDSATKEKWKTNKTMGCTKSRRNCQHRLPTSAYLGNVDSP